VREVSLQYHVLGPIEVLNGVAPVSIRRGKQTALLAALLIDANEAVSVDRLIDALWGATAPATVRKNVQVLISQLRASLDGGGARVIVTAGGGYRLSLPPASTDVERFEELFQQGRGELARGEPHRALTTLSAALSLWRGRAYADVAYDDFARAEIARLEERRMLAMEQRFEAMLALGDYEQVVAELEQLVERHPYRERAVGQLMRALQNSGRQADALAVYDSARRSMADELGITPGEPLRRLHAAILEGDVNSVTPAVAAISALSNVPRPASDFVGRQREVEEVTSLLTAGTRLVVLTGPGGSGKTRLAIESALRLEPRYEDGVFWVGMTGLRDPALVSETIAQALGMTGSLTAQIADRELLLVLDNFEQVIEAAPSLAELAEQSPRLSLLVTSRERLRVRGEAEYPVPPLGENEAVELFCARTGQAPTGEIGDLCRRLDNLPLAVELAAAKTVVLSPAEMLERLGDRLDLFQGGRDADARQRTLRATLDWSYELLPQAEQRLFPRLAVFAGGCTLASAEAVADADLATLQGLVDKSLLRPREQRFSMLDTIRVYALQRLDNTDNAAALHDRHARYFLELAETAHPRVLESSPTWLDMLETEHDNLRAALDWLATSEQHELAQRLAGALARFWDERGHLVEGQRRLESALRADSGSPTARAKALNGAADMAVSLGDASTARLRAAEALALRRSLGDPEPIAESEFMLGLALADEGDRQQARRLFETSAERFHEIDAEPYLLVVTRMLAWMCYELGERERGRNLHMENLDRARRLGSAHVESSTLGALAMIAADDGRLDDAVSFLNQRRHIHRDSHDKHGIARDISRVARVLADTGKPDTAAKLLSASDALHAGVGARPRPWLAEMNRQTLAAIHGQLDRVALAEAWQQGLVLSADQAFELAFDAL